MNFSPLDFSKFHRFESAPKIFLSSISEFYLEDLVLENGISRPNCLGGASTHALSGASIWFQSSSSLFYPLKLGNSGSSRILRDFLSYEIKFSEFSIDAPTPRKWRLYEFDGTHKNIFRSSEKSFQDHFYLQPNDFINSLKTLEISKEIPLFFHLSIEIQRILPFLH